VFNDHDLDKAADYIHVDYVQHNPMIGQGREGFVSYFSGFFTVAPDTTVEILDTIVQGDRVVVYTQFSGTYDGPFGELQVQSAPFDFTTMDIFQVEDGLLVEHWDVVDNLSLFTQLGALG
ncbi:MAG: ester cyclase, partial [Nannocystaceae bacterium]|nr:ester cyclase [Nannocystaceae bacterium]